MTLIFKISFSAFLLSLFTLPGYARADDIWAKNHDDVCLSLFEMKITCDDYETKLDLKLLQSLYVYFKELGNTEPLSLKSSDANGPKLIWTRGTRGRDLTLYFTKEASQKLAATNKTGAPMVSYNHELFKQLLKAAVSAESISKFVNNHFGIFLEPQSARSPWGFNQQQMASGAGLLLDLDAAVLKNIGIRSIFASAVTDRKEDNGRLIRLTADEISAKDGRTYQQAKLHYLGILQNFGKSGNLKDAANVIADKERNLNLQTSASMMMTYDYENPEDSAPDSFGAYNWKSQFIVVNKPKQGNDLESALLNAFAFVVYERMKNEVLRDFVPISWKNLSTSGNSAQWQLINFNNVLDSKLRSPKQDFLTSFAGYVQKPEVLKRLSQPKWTFFKTKVFGGTEYYSDASANAKIYIDSKSPDTAAPTLGRPLADSVHVKMVNDNLQVRIDGVADDISGIHSAQLHFVSKSVKADYDANPSAPLKNYNEFWVTMDETNLKNGSLTTLDEHAVRYSGDYLLDFLSLTDFAENSALFSPEHPVELKVRFQKNPYSGPSDPIFLLSDEQIAAAIQAKSQTVRVRNWSNGPDTEESLPLTLLTVPAPNAGKLANIKVKLTTGETSEDDQIKSTFSFDARDWTVKGNKILLPIIIPGSLSSTKFSIEKLIYAVEDRTIEIAVKRPDLIFQSKAIASNELMHADVNRLELSVRKSSLKNGDEKFTVFAKFPVENTSAQPAEFVLTLQSPTGRTSVGVMNSGDRSKIDNRNFLNVPIELAPHAEAGWYLLSTIEETPVLSSYSIGYHPLVSGSFDFGKNRKQTFSLLQRGIQKQIELH